MKYFLALCFLLTACQQAELTQEQRAYQERCLTDGNPWMYMSETHGGQVVGKPCNGCMPDGNNHLCALNEYEQFGRTDGRQDLVLETTE